MLLYVIACPLGRFWTCSNSRRKRDRERKKYKYKYSRGAIRRSLYFSSILHRETMSRIILKGLRHRDIFLQHRHHSQNSSRKGEAGRGETRITGKGAAPAAVIDKDVGILSRCRWKQKCTSDVENCRYLSALHVVLSFNAEWATSTTARLTIPPGQVEGL